MIKGYLNQTATWEQKTGDDGYGEPTFATGKEIAVRWEGKRRLVRDQYGNEVISEARVFCVETVGPGDVLTYDGTDWPVIAVSEIPGLDGSEHFREVAV
jgi:hypothetical protein